jgi:hypothetical protein
VPRQQGAVDTRRRVDLIICGRKAIPVDTMRMHTPIAYAVVAVPTDGPDLDAPCAFIICTSLFGPRVNRMLAQVESYVMPYQALRVLRMFPVLASVVTAVSSYSLGLLYRG